MLTNLPNKTRVYIFGSYLNSLSPHDLDVLVLYDPDECPPSTVYSVFEILFEKLKSFTGLVVDPTLLTFSEENEVGVLSKINAIELNELKNQKGQYRLILYNNIFRIESNTRA